MPTTDECDWCERTDHLTRGRDRDGEDFIACPDHAAGAGAATWAR